MLITIWKMRSTQIQALGGKKSKKICVIHIILANYPQSVDKYYIYVEKNIK